MRTIIVATGWNRYTEALNEMRPAELVPLVDRPFIQHVIEFLVDRGFTELDLILSHLPEQIEALLGEGVRWGVKIRHHLVRDPERPYSEVRQIASETPVLLVHGDRLPSIPRADISRFSTDLAGPVLYCWREALDSDAGKPPLWTGWVWADSSVLGGIPAGCGEAELEAYLQAQANRLVIETPKPLDVRSCPDILESNRRVLEKQFPELMLAAREASEGIWISRNVSLHPTAKLLAPVYIGENCRIGAGTALGPNTIISDNCVVDSRASVSDSIVFPGGFVGAKLELDHVLVDRNRLIDVQGGVGISVTDDFLLGSVAVNYFGRWLKSAASRVCGLFLLVLMSPILFATVLILKLARRGPVLYRTEVLGLPATPEPSSWRGFFLWSFHPLQREGHTVPGLRNFVLYFLPGLVNVVRGESSLAGIAPRTKEEILGMPRDWRALYLRSKPGLVTEAFIHCGPRPTRDELYSCEAFYSATAGIGHDLKLLARYFTRMLVKPGIYD